MRHALESANVKDAFLPMVLPCISVVLPVYNERENIAACLRGLRRALSAHEHEILVCYDFDADDTLPAIAAMSDKPASVRLVKNNLGRGAAFAIRAGFDAAQDTVHGRDRRGPRSVGRIFRTNPRAGAHRIGSRLQSFSVVLPPRSGADCVLHTSHGPGHDADSSWSFWTGVQID